jgi:Protein of unknown function (DUF3089)
MRTRRTAIVPAAAWSALVALFAAAAGLACPGWTVAAAAVEAPRAPDYASADAWAAWPGRPSAADAVPRGLGAAALAEDQKVDVFFIHPTTYLTSATPNARYDEPGLTRTRIDQGVLRYQASAFNACCRIYAPRYRQAAFGTFRVKDESASIAAYDLAYADVQRAFDYYLAHANRGQPFIIASHSQGSLHALRLLQVRIAGRPLAQQLVAAYVVGYYVPEEIEHTGIPVCRAPEQTGCLIDWNTIATGTSDSPRQRTRLIWFDGRYQPLGDRALVCVNPLSWTAGGTAPAALNLGALPAVRPGNPLRPPVPALTGASCQGGALQVSIPWTERRGFSGMFTLLGSYHIFDYNLFYTNIRVNAQQRVLAWHAARRRAAS